MKKWFSKLFAPSEDFARFSTDAIIARQQSVLDEMTYRSQLQAEALALHGQSYSIHTDDEYVDEEVIEEEPEEIEDSTEIALREVGYETGSDTEEFLRQLVAHFNELNKKNAELEDEVATLKERFDSVEFYKEA